MQLYHEDVLFPQHACAVTSHLPTTNPARAQRMMQAMPPMTKLDLAALRRAAAG